MKKNKHLNSFSI